MLICVCYGFVIKLKMFYKMVEIGGKLVKMASIPRLSTRYRDHQTVLEHAQHICCKMWGESNWCSDIAIEKYLIIT